MMPPVAARPEEEVDPPPPAATRMTCLPVAGAAKEVDIRSAKQDDIYETSNIILPCPGSVVIFYLVKDVIIILKSSI
jgi:hypothetical protein